MDSDKPDDLGNANDFWNELSGEFESQKKSLLISPNNDIRTTSDSLEASGNGKLDDWCDANDSVKAVLAKADGDKKSLRIVTTNDLVICSDQKHSRQNDYGAGRQSKPAKIDCTGVVPA